MYYTLKSALYSIFIVLFMGSTCKGKDECTIENTNATGRCTMLSNCRSVLEAVAMGTPFTVCEYKDNVPVVCCPRVKRIHEIKCNEYQSAIYIYKHSTSLLPSSASNDNSKQLDRCGHKTIPLIVGGEMAKAREFPHMALIGYESENDEIAWRCGGTLISDQYVLTAAHCLTLNRTEPKYVRLGELDLSTDKEESQPEDFNIEKLIRHPSYKRSLKYNDIALLKLDRKVRLNPYRVPACLPTTFEGPEKKAIATGWGQTNWSAKQSSHLQKVILDKFDKTHCDSVFRKVDDRRLNAGIQHEIQLCAGSENDEKDTCQGDSGGPLQVFHSNEYCMYTVIGITSTGSICGTPNVPGVYTRVYPYIDWIEREVWG